MTAHSTGSGHRAGFPPAQICGTATIGERGQVVIPADARKMLGIKPGDRFVVVANKLQGSATLVPVESFTKVAEFFVAKADKLGQLGQQWIDRMNGLYDQDDSDPAAEPDSSPKSACDSPAEAGDESSPQSSSKPDQPGPDQADG
ncbi:MAG: AbrB/MazE/SpoVT family DNA-binding domain-containing protein [Bifidobacteriaceae bacterium]|jgi:AbrB family looped-hinge helix DNA binding protein|nr:AbrB/MazE/SpoVT family DNA-binding domain-containing protein [Bifidobacteriaceae bacterium]